MCEALKTLMKPELDAAVEAAVEAASTVAKNEGVTELSTLLKRLKNGCSEKTLVDEGFSKDIIKSARELLEEIRN